MCVVFTQDPSSHSLAMVAHVLEGANFALSLRACTIPGPVQPFTVWPVRSRAFSTVSFPHPSFYIFRQLFSIRLDT
jgi:hypothetical protein